MKDFTVRSFGLVVSLVVLAGALSSCATGISETGASSVEKVKVVMLWEQGCQSMYAIEFLKSKFPEEPYTKIGEILKENPKLKLVHWSPLNAQNTVMVNRLYVLFEADCKSK